MSPHLIAMALGSAALHAGWHALLKNRKDTAAAGLAVVAGAATISGALAIFTGQSDLPAACQPWVLAAGLVEGVYFASLVTALAHLPLPIAYGISRGAGVLLAWPIALFALHESISVSALVGAVILSAGLGLSALERDPTSQPKSKGLSRGMAATLLCALSTAAYPLVYQQALRSGAAPFALFSASLALSVPIQLAWMGSGAIHRFLAELRIQPKTLVLAASLCAVSFLLLLGALYEGGAAHLSALRNTSVLFATAFAARTQPLTRVDWIRAALISVGTVLIAL